MDQSLFHDQDMASVVQRLQDLLDGRFLEEHKYVDVPRSIPGLFAHRLSPFRVNVAPIEETLSRFKSSYARLCTARQERQLAEVSGDVDKDRLTTDEVYGYVRSLISDHEYNGPSLTRCPSLVSERRYCWGWVAPPRRPRSPWRSPLRDATPSLSTSYALLAGTFAPTPPIGHQSPARVAYMSDHAHQVAIESLEHTLRNPEASAQSFTDLATFLAPRLQNADADVPPSPPA